MSHETDSFNRWDASQQLFTRCIFSMIYDQPDQMRELEALQSAFQEVLLDSRLSASMKAHILTPPSESILADHMDVVEINKVYLAHGDV
jgi:aminopeptidase N